MLSPVQVAHGTHSQRDRANTLSAVHVAHVRHIQCGCTNSFGFGQTSCEFLPEHAEPNNLDAGHICSALHMLPARALHTDAARQIGTAA